MFSNQNALRAMSCCGYSNNIEDKIRGIIYGNCVGDAIGLLTEFMQKSTIKAHYGKYSHLEYEYKIDDVHRVPWEIGDWTDDSDQMLLIADVLCEYASKTIHEIDNKPSNEIECNEMGIKFAALLLNWAKHGFQELGDSGGCGIGRTTNRVLHQADFLTFPHEAAKRVWKDTGCQVAPNGGVMRTSVVSLFSFENLNTVIENSLQFCLVTHHDYRCRASCVAVNVAIALMLQGDPCYVTDNNELNIDAICREAFHRGLEQIPEDYTKERDDYKLYMTVQSLEDLHLDDIMSIGYTLKCSGCGFWAVKQNNFRKTIESIVLAGGDSDTNCAVAGAMLGCRLGYSSIPNSWITGLRHKAWLEERFDRILHAVKTNSPDYFSAV